MNMRPSVSRKALCMLGMMGMMLAGSARAQFPYGDQVPAGATLAIGINDTKAAAAQLTQLPLVQALVAYLQGPSMLNNLEYQQFELEREKLAQALGYPVTLNEILGTVFKNAQLQMAGAEGGVTCILGVTDADKAAKLLEVLDNKFKELAAGDGISTATQATVSFDKVEVGGVQASHYQNNDDQAWWALGKKVFVLADTQQALADALAGSKPATGSLEDNEALSAMKEKLPWKEADVVGWVDADAMMQTSAGNPLASLPGIPKENKSAFTVDFQPDGLLSHLVTTANASEASPNIKVHSLQGLNYLGSSALVSLVSGEVDPDLIYQQFSQMLGMMGMMGAGQPGASPMAAFEQATGISIEQDLVPALGYEVALGVNGMAPGFPFPTVDLLAGAQVRDQEKMTALMTKLEAYLESNMGGMAMPDASGQVPAPPAFADAGDGIRSIETGMPGLSPSYTIKDGYLLFGLNLKAVQDALARAQGTQASAVKSPLYTELTTRAHTTQLYAYSSMDVGLLTTQVVQPFLPMLCMQAQMPPAQQQMLTDLTQQVLTHVGQLGSLKAQSGEHGLAIMRVKMQ